MVFSTFTQNSSNLFKNYGIMGEVITMDGILLIHKEAGMTSHDVVGKLRKILHIKKIGHSGTLDPNATGVLLVMIGKACKVLPFLEDTDKEYIAQLELGKRTLSDDIWSETLESAPIVPIQDFQSVLDTFKGKQLQLPPMVSSVRVNGRKLYEYARANESVERPLREVHIYDIECLNQDTLTFRMSCSSGTYVRSLCVDIAKKTGNLGCMSSLVRTRVGRFRLDSCVSLQDVANGNFTLHPMQEVLAHYPMITYEPIADIYNGKHVHIQSDAKQVVIVDKDGEIVAMYELDHHDIYRSVRGLW